jgi:hypothetical protein
MVLSPTANTMFSMAVWRRTIAGPFGSLCCNLLERVE